MAPQVRNGGSRHTGQAAPPHRNIQKAIKEKVVRLDHLVSFIKESEKNGSLATRLTSSEMKSCAESWLAEHKENPTDYIEKYRVMEREYRAKQNNEIKTDTVPICPNCNVKMVKRIARSGPRVGKEFWGCSNYPKCKNVVNVD